MNIDSIINYCSNKNKSTYSFPFDEDTLVFKLNNKIFSIVNLTPPHSISLKCDPERAIDLMEKYDFISPGYHMNKKHWITIALDRTLDFKLVYELIDHSYNLIEKKFKK